MPSSNLNTAGGKDDSGFVAGLMPNRAYSKICRGVADDISLVLVEFS